MTQSAKQQAITVGSIRITFLPDGDGRIDKLALFPGTTPDGWTLHPEWLDENGRVLTTIGGFLIQTGGRNLLIDTGYGPQQAEAPGLGPIVGGRLLQSLQRFSLGCVPSSFPLL